MAGVFLAHVLARDAEQVVVKPGKQLIADGRRMVAALRRLGIKPGRDVLPLVVHRRLGRGWRGHRLRVCRAGRRGERRRAGPARTCPGGLLRMSRFERCGSVANAGRIRGMSSVPSPRDPLAWSAVKRLYDQAIALPGADRARFVAAADADQAVRHEVLSLLAHDPDQTGHDGFLSQPAAASLLAALARNGERLGPWQIVRQIGAGGIGDVFEARRADGSYDGRAAIKLLKRGMDSAAVLRRFALERQVLGRLSHHTSRRCSTPASVPTACRIS